MAIRKIRQYSDEMLTKKAKPVKEITPAMLELLDDMIETLRSVDGLGLAAPQVGVLRRIIVIDYEGTLYELINPVIITSEGEQVFNEACLSIPGKSGDVQRPSRITVEALNRSGEPITVVAEAFLASIFCHELDHLDGILFIDKALEVLDDTGDYDEDDA